MSGDFEELLLNLDSDSDDFESDDDGGETDYENENDNEEQDQEIERWDLPFNPAVMEFQDASSLFKPEFQITAASTKFEILRTFITDDMINKIGEESNRYVGQVKQMASKSFQKWRQFDTGEFWRFIAILLMMGIVKKPSIKDYWSTDFLLETPSFARIMSRNRFQDILRSLHFVNSEAVPEENTDRFVKLGTFMTDILQNFRKAIHPGEFLCLDETLLAFKGRLSFRQYNPMKRARFGIKMFVLVDCATQFVLDILPYQGKSTIIRDRNWIQDMGFGGAAVLTMLWTYYGKFHKVVIDNWFNSPKLAKVLKDAGLYVLGTVQKRRKEMPKCQDMATKLLKGQSRTFSNGSILIERWIDRREVLMLNTFLSHEMMDSISSNPNNSREKPASVLLYNSTMGAVDNADKIIKPYESVRKSFKWYKKVFFRLVDLAVYNTSIVSTEMSGNTKGPYKTYLRSLIQEIITNFPSPTIPKGRPARVTATIPNQRLSGHHFPRKVVKANGVPLRSDCVYCKRLGKRTQTPFECKSCLVRLCIQGDHSCFEEYHSCRVLPVQQSKKHQRPHPFVSQSPVLSSIENLNVYESGQELFPGTNITDDYDRSESMFGSRSNDSDCLSESLLLSATNNVTIL